MLVIDNVINEISDVAGVKYENVYTLKFNSKTKQIPYVELNGEVIADSGLIIERLTKQFGLDPDSELDGADRALGRAVTAMVEQHTAQTGFHYRCWQDSLTLPI